MLCHHSETNVLDPPPLQTIGLPLLKSDDIFLGNQEILDPPAFKNPGHAPGYDLYKVGTSVSLLLVGDFKKRIHVPMHKQCRNTAIFYRNPNSHNIATGI